MRKGYHILILTVISVVVLHLTGFNAYAQQSRAKASADTSRILIGDHVNIVLELNQAQGSNFEFPVFLDTIIDKVEILAVSPIDTLELEGRLKLRQHLVITSFDTGFYVIPSFFFYDRLNQDSLKSNALPLEVLTLEIDTTKGISDIKLPFDVPYGFREIAPYIFVGLLLLALAIFIWYYYKKRRHQPEKTIVRVKPLEPAHTWALRELDLLSQEKLWQKGKIKLYHSRLTDIIRTYLEFRFDIPALECTTSETVAACSIRQEIDEGICANLKNMLELADLVKFAKWNPLPDENENSQRVAYDFVLRTKLSPVLRQSNSDSTNPAELESAGKEGTNAE